MVKQDSLFMEMKNLIMNQHYTRFLHVENITIYFNTPELEIYLKNALEPYYAIQKGETNPAKIQMKCISVHDIDKYAEIFQGSEEIIHSSPSFHERYYKQMVKLDHWILYRSKETGSITIEDLDHRTIYLLLHPEFYLKETKSVLRDQIIYVAHQRDGAVPFHSAALVRNHHGILIMGDKGNGKTSTNLALLHRQAAFVSNDLTFVKCVDDQIMAKGAPESIRIGIGTLYQHEQLYDRIPKNYIGYEKDNPQLYDIAEKIELEWVELADCFQVALETGWTRMKYILFPVIQKETSGVTVNKIDESELHEQLMKNILSPYYNGMEPWLVMDRLDKETVENTVNLVVRHMVSKLKAYRVAYNGNVDDLRKRIDCLLEGEASRF